MFENMGGAEAAAQLRTDLDLGLSEKEANKRLLKNGSNELVEKRTKSTAESFLEQLNDPLIFVLLAAAVVSVILKETSDAVIIGVVVCINAAVGVIQEGKARKALDSLKKLTAPRTLVIREGVRKEIAAKELVEGDVVCLDAGCLVPADLRLVETENLKIDESALTGEDMPVEKDASFTAEGTKELPVGDRINMAYMSTVVTYGRGKGIVCGTGMNSEIGRIAGMLADTKEELTPLQKKLGELGKILSILSVILCAGLFLIALTQERNVFDMLVTAISLAVAAVPEGLPAVVTICLAMSVTRMVKVNTIVRKLPSVETLGAVSVVCSDKTGTLTQNRMTVEECYLGGTSYVGDRLSDIPEKEGGREFLNAIVLCNDASISAGERVGDPTETALLDLGASMGIYREDLEYRMPRCGELPFDSDRKMMTTLHERPHTYASRRAEITAAQGFFGQSRGTGYVSYTKGAPDEVLRRCTRLQAGNQLLPLHEERRQEIYSAIREMSSKALRTLAVAECANVSSPREDNLVFLGLVGMKDPIRPEALEAVETFKEAGVRTVMITGDHVDTAYAIGKQLDIAWNRNQCMTGAQMASLTEEELQKKMKNTTIFARVSPAQKVRIVEGFRANGEIVAMTGDGVNDAPSLKAADIGIAMGKNGTDVAKEAAKMILTDDNFATIEKAIEEGRGVYENIRKSVIFLLSSNLGEILTMFTAVVFGLASPLKSSHILWINLITDSLPALALGMDENDGKELMKNHPRKKNESLFSRGGLYCTCFYGILITLISLAAFLMLPCVWLKSQGYGLTLEHISIVLGNGELLSRAQTYAFTVLGMSQLFHAVGMRDTHKSVFRMNHWKNKLMLVACVLGFLLQLMVTNVNFFIGAFGTVRLSLEEWGLLLLLASFPLLAHEIIVISRKIVK